MPECQTWTAKVIVLIIFVFAIVFDNAVVGPWKPWSLFCGACENLNGQRWDQTGIDRVWREKHVTDGWCSRTSSELQYIHKILSWLATCREQSYGSRLLDPMTCCYGMASNSKTWILPSANWDSSIKLGVYHQTLQSNHPKLGVEHVWASKKLESSMQMQVSPSKSRLNYHKRRGHYQNVGGVSHCGKLN